jgi:hypothetical protein
MDSGGLNPGRRDRIPIPLWNRIVRATETVESGSFGSLSEVSLPGRASNIVIARNASVGNIERYGIVRIDGISIVTDPGTSESARQSFLERPIVIVNAPQGDDVCWGVAVDPIKVDECGRVAVSGVVPARVDFASGSPSESNSMKYATPVAMDTTALKAASAAPGAATVMWRDPGAGERWALLRLGDSHADPEQPAAMRVGKTTSAWNKGTAATITLYESGTPPSETSSSETLANCINKFANVAADKWVTVAQAKNGYYYLVAAEC